MSKCFNCGSTEGMHDHHVVPRSLGGVATVPLCHVCHGKAHGRERGFRDTGELTRTALAVRRERGQTTSHPPWGTRAEGGRLLPEPREAEVLDRVAALRAEGRSVREIHAALRDQGVVSRRGRPLAVSSVGVLVILAAQERP